MSGGTVFQPKTITTTDSKQDMQNYLAGSTGSAKVTLIKPVQGQETSQQDNMAENSATEKLSSARPKVGRPSTGSVLQESKSLPYVAKEEPKKIELPPIPRELSDMTSARPWDFKFALVLVTLFIAVNLGLVLLLHNNHHAAKNTAHETVLSEKEKPALPPVPAIPRAYVTAPAETMAAPSAIAAPALPAAAPSLTAAPATMNVPAAAVQAPVVSTSVASAPPPVQTPVSAPPVAVAAAPAQVPAAVATTPAEASAASQDLLSIIGKN